MPTFDIRSFGAVGDGVAYDTAAIQKAVEACHAAGGGRVVVPAGYTYLTGTIRLLANVELHVEGGAKIIAGAQKQDYPDQELRCLVEAVEADNVSLTGTGVIDGRAKLFMESEGPYIYKGSIWRPRLVGFVGCNRVVVRDITLKDSANWGLHLAGCQNVVISGISILNDLKVPNCDGIDPDHCRNVRISDCHIEAGDDCIVIKNSKEFARYGATENITVTGCTLVSTSAAIKIGTESVDDFRNLVFDACVIQKSSRGLTIQLRDMGNVENVIFSNMIVDTRLFSDAWWGRSEPIYLTSIRRFGKHPEQLPAWNAENRVGRVRHVRLSNILCRGESGAFLAADEPDVCPDGTKRYYLEDVVLDNVRVEVEKLSKWPGGWHDYRPRYPKMPDWENYTPQKDPAVVKHPTAGVYAEHVKDLTLRNVSVVWGEQRQDHWSHALEALDVPGLKLENFTGDSAQPGRVDAIIIDGKKA